MKPIIPMDTTLARCLYEAIGLAERFLGAAAIIAYRPGPDPGRTAYWHVPQSGIWFDYAEPSMYGVGCVWLDSDHRVSVQDLNFASHHGWLIAENVFLDSIAYRRSAYWDFLKRLSEAAARLPCPTSQRTLR